MLIDEKLIMEALNTALATGADFAEIFIEESLNNAVSAVDSRIDNVSSTIISGVGIRVYLGLKSVSATASAMDRDSVLAAARNAAQAIADSKRSLPPFVLKERVNTNIHRIEIVPSTVSVRDKADYVLEM